MAMCSGFITETSPNAQTAIMWNKHNISYLLNPSNGSPNSTPVPGGLQGRRLCRRVAGSAAAAGGAAAGFTAVSGGSGRCN